MYKPDAKKEGGRFWLPSAFVHQGRRSSKTFRAPGKLPQVHRGWESSLARMGLTGRCPVTRKLMSQMIGMILKNSKSTIELLRQNHARQLVRQRHLSQGEDHPGLAPCFFTEAVTATNREQQRCRVHLFALQKLSQLFGRELFPPRIEEDQPVPLFILLRSLLL